MFIKKVLIKNFSTEPLNHEQPTFLVDVNQLIQELMKEILQTRQATVHVNPRVLTLHLSLTFSIYTCALCL